MQGYRLEALVDLSSFGVREEEVSDDVRKQKHIQDIVNDDKPTAEVLPKLPKFIVVTFMFEEYYL